MIENPLHEAEQEILQEQSQETPSLLYHPQSSLQEIDGGHALNAQMAHCSGRGSIPGLGTEILTSCVVQQRKEKKEERKRAGVPSPSSCLVYSKGLRGGILGTPFYFHAILLVTVTSTNWINRNKQISVSTQVPWTAQGLSIILGKVKNSFILKRNRSKVPR